MHIKVLIVFRVHFNGSPHLIAFYCLDVQMNENATKAPVTKFDVSMKLRVGLDEGHFLETLNRVISFTLTGFDVFMRYIYSHWLHSKLENWRRFSAQLAIYKTLIVYSYSDCISFVMN